MPSSSTRLSVSGSSLAPTLRGAIAAASQLGFKGIALDGSFKELHSDELSNTALREIRHLLGSQDTALVNIRTNIGRRGLGAGADLDRILHSAGLLFRLANGLGATMACIDVGLLPAVALTGTRQPKITAEQAGAILLPPTLQSVPSEELPSGPPVDPVFVSHVDSALNELGMVADRYNLPVALASELSSGRALAAATRRVNCPWFGVELDPALVLADDWSIDETFDEMARFISHVRGRDATLGHDRRTRPAIVGMGNVDWRNVADNLVNSGYHGWITLDPTDLTDHAVAIQEGAAFLSGLMK